MKKILAVATLVARNTHKAMVLSGELKSFGRFCVFALCTNLSSVAANLHYKEILQVLHFIFDLQNFCYTSTQKTLFQANLTLYARLALFITVEISNEHIRCKSIFVFIPSVIKYFCLRWTKWLDSTWCP